MRSPDEIKKGMTCCLTRWEVDHLASCHTDCPYRSEGIWCRNVLMADIKAWNKQLESRLAQVERERDAAVDDCSRFPCATCSDQVNGDLCYNCNVCNDTTRTNYEWRGVCEENTKDGKDGQE